MFFHNNVNYEIINKFLLNHNLADKGFEKRINNTDSSDGIQLLNNLFKDILIIVREIYTSPSSWDIFCEISIHKYGEKFINYLKNYKYLSNELGIDSQFENSDIRDLYLICINFLMEVTFFSETDLNSSKLLNNESIEQFKKNLDCYTESDKFDSEYKAALLNAKYTVPLDLMKNLYFSKEVQAIKSLDKSVSKIDVLHTESSRLEERLLKLKLDHESSLTEKLKEVKDLENTLSRYETAFNFVGLYKGFNNLAIRKQKESTNSFIFLLILSFALIIFPLYGMVTVYSPSSDLNSHTPFTHLLAFLPLISLELILIYFFRVVLHNYKSVQAQVLQIELRQTLCQFIQNYADYSKDIKKDDPAVLEKFENLIFSGIISDAENLPSTFDGMDQITKLLSSLKKT
ncbi:hypothetical protein HC000_01055 [Pseudoalteromonas sp. MIP2626]|uniref:hypothetical protein n=1 Tax=Pseudoalteromonas sp. MIP2626 TaxID=2705464 RepID=UPI0015CD2510|nr:hypothetical protein [Pseudoalteromonas sp. MIP2626]NYR11093.1 hypothetical protein [Pseudoalteromonas sp. MIP2626]